MKGLPPNSSFALRPLPASYLHAVHSAKTRSAIPQQPHSHFCPKFCNDFSATRKLFQASGCLSLLCIQQLVDRILCARHTIFRRYLTAQNLVSHIQKKLLCLKACIARGMRSMIQRRPSAQSLHSSLCSQPENLSIHFLPSATSFLAVHNRFPRSMLPLILRCKDTFQTPMPPESARRSAR